MKKLFILITIQLILKSAICQIVDWKFQVTQFVEIATTSSNPTSYIWHQESNKMQGVQINLNPTEIVDIFIEANNAKIDFNHWIDAVGNVNTFIIQLQVSIDNSSYTTLYSGSAVLNYVWDCSSTFATPGEHNLKVKCLNYSGNYQNREYNVKVVPQSQYLLRDQFENCMRVWKSGITNAIPIVLSSGFDAYNIKPEQYYRSAGNELFNCLLANGFDVYVVNYKFNGQDLRNNAAVYSSAIKYVSLNFFNSQKVVAAGISMGGIISRYALSKAESINVPLPVSSWLSIDAPHRGAVISKDLQDYLKDHTNNEFDKYALECTAAKILLNYNTYDVTQTQHNSFYNELNSLNTNGYPHNSYNIGISFSTTDPNPNSGTWLQITTPLGIYDEDFQLSAEEKVAGSFLPEVNKDPYTVVVWWGLFWGTVEMNQISYPTFIPHSSSLDFDNQNPTKFDEILVPSVTGFHTEIPIELIDPIINALKFPSNLKLQNTTISGVNSYIAGSSITAGYYVNPNITAGDVNINSGSNVLFQAANLIDFMPGFNANYDFIAKIETPNLIYCAGSGNQQLKSSHSPSHEKTPSQKSAETLKQKSADISYFPNPVQNYLSIQFFNEIDNMGIIKVFDVNSRLVLEKEYVCSDNFVLDLSTLQDGIYVVNISSNNTNRNFKIIKRQ